MHFCWRGSIAPSSFCSFTMEKRKLQVAVEGNKTQKGLVSAQSVSVSFRATKDETQLNRSIGASWRSFNRRSKLRLTHERIA